MAQLCLDRVSRAESNLILDSILTYYTDISDRYTQNDDNYSFTTMSDRQIQNDTNHSPIVMANSIAIGDIGEFPLPPHTIRTAPHKWFATAPQDMLTYPIHKAKDNSHKTRGNYQLPAVVKSDISRAKPTATIEHTREGDSWSKAQHTIPRFPGTEGFISAISKPDHTFHPADGDEHWQSPIELPLTNIQSPESHLRREIVMLDKKSIPWKHKLARRRHLYPRQDYGKGSLISAKKEGLATTFPYSQQTLSYDGSVSSTGQSQYHPDSFDFQFEDTAKRRRNKKSSPAQKYQFISSMNPLSNHGDFVHSSIRQEGTSQRLAEDSSEHAISRPLHPCDFSQKQPSDYQTTHANIAIPPHTSSFLFETGSLNLSPNSSDKSVRTFSHRPPSVSSSNTRNPHGSDRSQFRFSQDLHFQSSSQPRIKSITSDHMESREGSRERSLLLAQEPLVEGVYRNQDTRVRTTGPVRHHGILTELQNQILPHGEVSIERRHATALLLSPQPQRLFPSSFYREGSEIDLFEEHLKQEPRTENPDQSSSSISEEIGVLYTSRNNVQQNESAKGNNSLNSRNRSNTAYNAEVMWPLPSYRIDQGRICQRSHTQPSQSPSTQWDISKQSDLQSKSNNKRLPALPKQNAHKDRTGLANERMRLLGPQEAIDRPPVIRATAISKLRSDLEPRPVRTLRRQKSLPALPEDLDTSAIATFPLSREVPLPQFVTAEAMGKNRTRKIASSSDSFPSTKQPSRTPIPGPGVAKLVSVPMKLSRAITDEGELLSMTNNTVSHEQDVRDAWIVNSHSAGTDSHRHQYRGSPNSREAAAKALPRDEILELLKTKRKRKILKGCGPSWTRLWHGLSCSGPERRVIVSESSTKTS